MERRLITVAEARNMLPQVGDRLERQPSVHECGSRRLGPRPCTVVEVNRKHMWYRVVFDRTGYYMCFKVPDGGDA